MPKDLRALAIMVAAVPADGTLYVGVQTEAAVIGRALDHAAARRLMVNMIAEYQAVWPDDLFHRMLREANERPSPNAASTFKVADLVAASVDKAVKSGRTGKIVQFPKGGKRA